MKLISTYKKIERRTIYDCRVKSIMELMKNYGVELTEYEVLLISEAITFVYDKIEIPGLIHEAIPYSVVSTDKLEKTFFENLGIKYVEEKIGDSEKEWGRMKNLLDHDTPIMFRIDSRFLNNENKENGKLNLYYLSTLLLVGYEEETHSVFIVLTNTNETDRTTKLSMQDFMKYRNTSCVPKGADYLCFYLDESSGIVDVTKERVRKAVFNGLRRVIETMLEKKQVRNFQYGVFLGSVQTTGISGMRNLRNDLNMFMNTYEERNESGKKFIKFILVFIRNNLLFGSRTGFRCELAECLKMCHEKYGFQGTLDAGEKLHKISKYWTKMFTQLSGIVHKSGDVSQRLKEVIITLETIIDSEEEQYEVLHKKLIYESDL